MIAIKPGSDLHPPGGWREPIERPVLGKTKHSNTRALFRRLLTKQLQKVSKKPSASMHYTAENYLAKVVLGAKVQLVGWPRGIPFGNASDLPHGTEAAECLLRELESGRMFFRRLRIREAREIAQKRITPEVCLERPPRRGRSDVKVHRARTVKFARYPLNGPKTPALVEDSPAYSDSESEVEDEEAARAEVEDNVSEWSEESAAAETEDGVSEWSEEGL